ncbi:MAG: fatty acid desaturase [Planctomycetota bacterium]|nr:MAG: fatty acid desaturase [Planctomycetota bacterium]
MESTKAKENQFSVAQARDIVRDLFEAQPTIYWLDFLCSLTVGYAAASIYLTAPWFSVTQIAAYLVAGFALFRVGSFIHEIVHFPGQHMRGFKIAWNLLAGIPMLMPSFFYLNHIDHHSPKHYGTGQDGEYLPLGNGPLRDVLYFFLQVLVLPLAMFTRFAIVTPISFLSPAVRTWALERFSSYVINLKYRQQIPASASRTWWAAMEAACCLRAWMIPLGVAMGISSWDRIPALYLLAVLTLGLNYIRNMVAHRYESDGQPMSPVGQLSDSINFDGTPIVTELFFPLYLRYHALHHLLPTLPYHNLKKAHQRLIDQLPAGSPYHQALYPGFWSLMRDVWSHAVAASRDPNQRRKADQWYQRREAMLQQFGSPQTRSDAAPEPPSVRQVA